MNETRVKLSCYTTSLSMSVVGNLSPLLFLTFRSLYGISYSLMGLLVLVNFATQLGIDLIFSFFSHRFDIQKTVRLTPILTASGLFLYALWPLISPQTAYLGILLGTVIFSVSAGLCEVLISPIIAALPSPDPEREMSKLHSVYAWGVVLVIAVSTLFLLVFGHEHWHYLALMWTAVPLAAAFLFFSTALPSISTPKNVSAVHTLFKTPGIWLSFAAIFLGGATELTMAQWSSGYLERALGIPKLWGDVFGVALFSVMLGLGRTLYAKLGRKIERVLLWGSIGALVCYLVAALSPVSVIGLIACALTGFCASMLWPGNLIVASERFPTGGVFIFAVMAAGGDFGASAVPQLVGIVADYTISIPGAQTLAQSLSLSADQLGMRFGMLLGAFFPLLGIFVQTRILKTKKFLLNYPKMEETTCLFKPYYSI